MAGMKHGELLYRFSTMPPEKSSLVLGEVRKHRQFGSCLNGGAGRLPARGTPESVSR